MNEQIKDERIRQIVCTFSPRTQAVIDRFGHGETYQAIAQRLDMSVHDVKLTLAAALVEISRRRREEPQCWPKSKMPCWVWVFLMTLMFPLGLLRGCWS